ncbi:hypothetical protein ACTS9D_02285 [Empedobacter brevis]
MEYRRLGQTDLELSAITYGAFAIGGNWFGMEVMPEKVNISLRRMRMEKRFI